MTPAAFPGSLAGQALRDIIELRHELHQHPEIRFQERWTSDRIARFLDELGIPHTRGHAKGTGIVAVIRGGPGRTVALRADMDALEVHEETGLPYASLTPGLMHACGHDGHTASLCGAVGLLAGLGDDLPGTVKCIFQPAEETAAGGRFIVEEGLIDDVDAVFALHGWPTLPVGAVSCRPGCMMAGARDFEVIVHGKGCHGADPASGADPILAAAHIITALQTIVSREINPWDAGVVSVGVIEAGTATNIIPETAALRGTLRSVTLDGLDQLGDSVRRVATSVAEAFRTRAEVNIHPKSYPPLINDPGLAAFAEATVVAEFGCEAFVPLAAPSMTAEDFAFYTMHRPGAFLYVGVNPDPGTPYPPLHSNRYVFTDETLPVAARLLASLAWRFLKS